MFSATLNHFNLRESWNTAVCMWMRIMTDKDRTGTVRIAEPGERSWTGKVFYSKLLTYLNVFILLQLWGQVL